jgi:hypothetical protein
MKKMSIFLKTEIECTAQRPHVDVVFAQSAPLVNKLRQVYGDSTERRKTKTGECHVVSKLCVLHDDCSRFCKGDINLWASIKGQ